MAGNQFVEELADGDDVDGLFAVKYKKPVKDYRNGHFFVLGLADRTGEMQLKYWGGENQSAVERIYEKIEEGDVIRVKGEVSVYRDKEQIDVEEGEDLIKIAEDYDIEEFVPAADTDIDELERRLRDEVREMNDTGYRGVVEAFLDDDTFMERYREAPAAMFYHHAYLGGLMEHVLSMMETVKTLKDAYPSLDLDLMKAGCFLHDIGKVDEFAVTTSITQSEAGLLRGHISLGEELLADKLEEVEIDERKVAKLHHIILAHHGTNEHGSPKEPAFPEAAAVYHADEMDAKLFQYVDLTENAETNDFHTYTDRFGQLYLR